MCAVLTSSSAATVLWVAATHPSVSLALNPDRLGEEMPGEASPHCCPHPRKSRALETVLLVDVQVEQHGHSARASAVAAVLERTVQQTLATPGGLSGHPAACGARFRLLLLALTLAT